jgi:hypothetical protein
MRNLQEGRHALAEKVFHGRRRELFQRYRKGMEDQLDTLGIVLNCVVLWNTVYIDAALRQLQAQGYPAKDEDVARLSPFMRKHINVHGKYSFTVPKSAGPSKGATATRQLLVGGPRACQRARLFFPLFLGVGGDAGLPGGALLGGGPRGLVLQGPASGRIDLPLPFGLGIAEVPAWPPSIY